MEEEQRPDDSQIEFVIDESESVPNLNFPCFVNLFVPFICFYMVLSAF